MNGQRGTVAIPMVVICMTLLLVTGLMFTLFASYFAKRTGQTAADAAAMGALRALNLNLHPIMDEVASPRVKAFWKTVDDAMAQWDEQQAERQALCAALREADPAYEGPECEAPEPEARRQYWLDQCGMANSLIGRDLCVASESGETLPPPAMYKGFLTARERGCLIVKPGSRVRGEMLARADSFSRRNGGPGLDGSNFEYPFRADPADPYQPVVLIRLEQRVGALVLDTRALPGGTAGAQVRSVFHLTRMGHLEPSYPHDLADCP